MTPGDRQEALEESVRAFRLAADALRDPAPELFASLAAPQEGLMGELPLVLFSPFDALSDYEPAARDGLLRPPSEGWSRAPDLAAQHEIPRVTPERSQTPGGPPGGVPSRIYEAAIPPPSFSFRGSDAPGRRTRLEPPLSGHRGSSNAFEPAQTDRRGEKPPAAAARLDPPMTPDERGVGMRASTPRTPPSHNLMEVAADLHRASTSSEQLRPEDGATEGPLPSDRDGEATEPRRAHGRLAPEAYGEPGGWLTTESVRSSSDRQEALEESVRAFGLAAETLGDPALELFASLAAPQEGLMGELPPVLFSPFGALPENVVHGGGNHEAYRPPGGRKELSRALSSQDGEPAIEPPPFPFELPGSPLEDQEHERLEAPGGYPDSSDAGLSRVAEHHPVGVLHEVRSRNVLESLAEGAFKAASGSSPETPAHPSGASPFSAERLTGPREPGRRAGYDSSLMPTERSSPHLGVTSKERPAGGSPDAAGGDVDSLDAPSAGIRPESALGAYGSSALASIDALVEHLLTPGARIGESVPTSEARDGNLARPGTARGWELSGHGASSNPSPDDLSDDVYAEPAGRLQAESPPPVPGKLIEESPDRYADAETTFAALINDVLMRQARRHGVDLS